MNSITLTTYNNGPATTSRNVADVFGKRHDNILRNFDNLECSEEFNRLNFELVSYTDAKGEMRREIIMTKNGFTFLAMGFTGAKAAAFKEAYIKQFDAMEQSLKGATLNDNRLLTVIENLSHALYHPHAITESVTAVTEPITQPIAKGCSKKLVSLGGIASIAAEYPPRVKA